MHHLLILTALGFLTATSSAQNVFTFDIDPPQSNFTWSGSTSIGPIVGNPSNAFQLSGVVHSSIGPGPGPFSETVALVGGDALVVPDLHGAIPNLFPFLPPLATIDVTNLRLSPSSPPFTVPLGTPAFTTDVTLVALAGTLTVTPLGQVPQTTDLTGLSSTPTPTDGALAAASFAPLASLHLDVDTTFPFSDPTSGISGSLTIVGNLESFWAGPFPTTYCQWKVNSAGCDPQISAYGFASYTHSSPLSCFLTASFVLNNKSGILFYGFAPASIPFGGGTLCVLPPIRRTPVQNSAGNPPPNDCSGSYFFDVNAHIQSGADPAFVPGAIFYAQFWSRDPGFAPPSNIGLTNAMELLIAP